MKFKTIIGRVAYSDEFDVLMEKEVEKLSMFNIKEVKLATSDRMIVAIFVYEDKPEAPKPATKRKPAAKPAAK